MKKAKGNNGGDSVFPRPEHDHRACIEDAVRSAADLCGKRRVRLTPLRRRVLELVWNSHKPIGAYDILASLRRERQGAAPPTVYRALDFLVEQGLVHRIESLNAFVGCPSPDDDHGTQFLICRSCGQAAELSDQAIDVVLLDAASRSGFAVDWRTVELMGLCSACRTDVAVL